MILMGCSEKIPHLSYNFVKKEKNPAFSVEAIIPENYLRKRKTLVLGIDRRANRSLMFGKDEFDLYMSK